jgi:deferrochelatase/peroxidase EfeB
MLLLADKDERNLPWEDLAGQKLSPAQQVEALRTWLGNFGIHAVPEVCAIEYGRVLRNAQGKSIEHFGYVDVGSEPLFFQKDVDEVQENEGIDRWNPGAGPDLVLVKEPNSLLYNQGRPTYGSYFVFRKLEQDVNRFDDYLRALQTGLGLQGHDRARAEALVMGRFRDGTPVVLQRTPGTSDSLLNNFDFRNDPVGMRCPFQAHIRRMNPRGERDRGIRGAIAEAIRKLLPGKAQREYERIRRDPAAALRRLSVEEQGKEERIILSDLAKALERLSVDGQREVDRIQNAVDGKYDERRHRIARRSMPYGKQGEPKVGLLFMCYQRNICQQFEVLQANWANNEDFPIQGTGPDAIVGPQKGGPTPTRHKWPRRWRAQWPWRWDTRPEGHETLNFQSCVTLKGGEYFFAPSIPFLKNIRQIGTSTVSA